MSTEVAETKASYRFSALLKAAGVMWKVAGVAFAAILVNMVVQAFLTWLDFQSGFNFGFLIVFLISAVSALGLYAVLSSAALGAVDGDRSVVTERVKANAGNFVLWALVQWALILLATLLHPGLAILVAALTPFLPLAAIEGQKNALGANFRALGKKFGRWLLTSVILAVAAIVFFLLAAVNTFFVQGTPASVFFWLVMGVIAWWLLTAWALVYRAADGD